MKVDFYQLSDQPVERVLPQVARRVLADGARLLVVSADEDLAGRIDGALWEGPADAFLAHGRAGAGREALQPVLISPTPDAANGARHVALADGAWREEALGFERAFLFFDDGAIAAARSAWKSLAAREDVERRFWRQQDGRWSQVA